MRTLALLLSCFIAHTAGAAEPAKAIKLAPIKVEKLLQTTQSWNGAPLAWPTGQAELTSIIVEIAPGAATGWHYHPVPSFGYILQGDIEVEDLAGHKARFHTGEAVAETVDVWHNGHNIGTTPLRIAVFYSGVKGQPLTIKKPAGEGFPPIGHHPH